MIDLKTLMEKIDALVSTCHARQAYLKGQEDMLSAIRDDFNKMDEAKNNDSA